MSAVQMNIIETSHFHLQDDFTSANTRSINLIHVSQADFRKVYSTYDNIFILKALFGFGEISKIKILL